MIKSFPYQVRTATGDQYDVRFPLHAETGSAVDVENLLTAVLQTLDREVGLKGGRVSNGDVLQAVAMALAVRAGMIAAPSAVTSQLARELMEQSLAAFNEAERSSPTTGHA